MATHQRRRTLRQLASELSAGNKERCTWASIAKGSEPLPVWYCAIGSMVNPTSLANRNLRPLHSIAVEVLDFERTFRGHSDSAKIGMAFAEPCVGSSFHAVLHLMSATDMKALDDMEAGYVRVAATCRQYDGKQLDATVYTAEDLDSRPIRAPEQRYIDIIVAGCKHYGVHPSAVEQLEQVETIPRPLPSEFKSFPVPAHVQVARPWTEEQLSATDRVVALNGKVLQYIGPDDWPIWRVYSPHIGTHFELIQSRMMYDPQHGTHDLLHSFTREHCARMEDSMASNSAEMWRVVGLLPQEYVD
jgi:hypothetical protein